MADNFATAWADEFSGSPVWTLGQLAVAVILGGKAWYEWANEHATPTSVFVWTLALMVYVVVVVMFHAWRAWTNEHDIREAAERKLKTIENARPNVQFEKARFASKVKFANVDQGVWELWFLNQPEFKDTDTTARKLSARIEFCDDEWHQVLECFGQWALTAMPDHAGWNNGISHEIDLPPTYTHGKLLLVVNTHEEIHRIDGDQEFIERGVYALSGENLHAYHHGDHPSYLVGADINRVRVTLSAVNMIERQYQFMTKRSDDGAVNGVTQIRTEAPSL